MDQHFEAVNIFSLSVVSTTAVCSESSCTDEVAEMTSPSNRVDVFVTFTCHIEVDD